MDPPLQVVSLDDSTLVIRRTVDELLEGRQFRILVTHSHGHWAGDAQFADLPLDAVAPICQEAVAAFFEVEAWPRGAPRLDLGNRPVVVLPTPGHLADHVVRFDR